MTRIAVQISQGRLTSDPMTVIIFAAYRVYDGELTKYNWNAPILWILIRFDFLVDFLVRGQLKQNKKILYFFRSACFRFFWVSVSLLSNSIGYLTQYFHQQSPCFWPGLVYLMSKLPLVWTTLSLRNYAVTAKNIFWWNWLTIKASLNNIFFL